MSDTKQPDTAQAPQHGLIVPKSPFGVLTGDSPHVGPLVRVRVRQELRKALATRKVKGKKGMVGIPVSEQEDMLAAVGDDAIDAAYHEAVVQQQTKVGGPVIDFFKNNPELIAMIVQILLAALGVG